jgi:hypothetical protein
MKRSPKVRAAQKRAQRKTQSRRKSAERRRTGVTPKPIRAARPALTELHPFGGYELPAPEPLPASALERLSGTDVATMRNEFEYWADTHSHKHASSYWPDMSDAQVSQAWKVFVFNKEQGYGYDIDVGGEIREYMADWDLDEDITDADEGNYK